MKLVKKSCLSLPVPITLSICLSVVWSFTFHWDYDCDKINLVLSVNSMITILVKLVQIIRGYIAIFVAWQSFAVSMSISFERHAFHIIIVLCQIPHFSGTWSSSCYRKLVNKGEVKKRKSKFKEYRNSRGDLKILFLEVIWNLRGTGTPLKWKPR